MKIVASSMSRNALALSLSTNKCLIPHLDSGGGPRRDLFDGLCVCVLVVEKGAKDWRRRRECVCVCVCLSVGDNGVA